MSKIEKITNAILAVFLIALIFTFGYMTISENLSPLFESARSYTQIREFLPEEYNVLEYTGARIRSFESKFNDVLWHKDGLGYLNSSVQYMIGKDMINTGGANMITLKTGDLYDISDYQDTTPQTDEIIAFAETLDVPFIYMLAHATTYGMNDAEGGYAMLDKGPEISDDIVTNLRAGGINVIDSRDVLTGVDTSLTIFRTDKHWTSYAALLMARSIAEELGLDSSMLDPAKFESLTYENMFMGTYGTRVGEGNVERDDVTVFWPSYDTEITRYTLNNGEETTVTGDFNDAAIKWEYLTGEDRELMAYKCYGLTEDFEHYHNPDAPSDKTIMVFKDSFGAPVGVFLSLVVEDVYLVDMRKTDKSATYFVELYQPDVVIMAYSRQMLTVYDVNLLPEEN